MKNSGPGIVQKVLIPSLIFVSSFGIGNAILKANHIKDAEHRTPSALIQDDKGIGVDGMTRSMLDKEAARTRKAPDSRLADTPVRVSDKKSILLAQVEPKKTDEAQKDKTQVSAQINQNVLKWAYPAIGTDYIEFLVDIRRSVSIASALKSIGLDTIPKDTYTLFADGSLATGDTERGKKMYIIIPKGLLLTVDTYLDPKDNVGHIRIKLYKLDNGIDANLPHTFVKNSNGEDFIIFINKDELGIERLDHTEIEFVDLREKVGQNGVPAQDIQFKPKDPMHVEVYIKGKLSFTVDMNIYDYVSN